MDASSPEQHPPDPPPWIPNLLLALAVLGLGGTLFFAAAWLHKSAAPVRLLDLPEEDHRRLMEELRTTLPGVYEPAWFEPRIAYTLRRSQEIDLGYDTFRSNSLGYRTGEPQKVPGTFRVIFVGDSWTFGHGVRQEDSFPAAFETMANALGDQSIEAWTLALSGYNTLDQVAALRYFLPLLEPDAVVFCPSSNDNDSRVQALPQGQLGRFLGTVDGFGDPSAIRYNHIGVDSYRYRKRWRQAMHTLREAEILLERQGIPSFFFFVAHWPDAMAHYLMRVGEIHSPYLVNPEPLRTKEWLNPPPFSHGNPAANRLYGRMVYRALAELLDMPPPPPPQTTGEEIADATALHQQPPAGDWGLAAGNLLAELTHRFIDESYLPSKTSPKQCLGPMRCATGRMGRSTAVLVRRQQGAEQLEITLARLPRLDRLYPLTVTVTIPALSGDATTRVAIPQKGPQTVRREIPLPDSIPTGAAIDVFFESSRWAALDDGLETASVRIQSLIQIP